MTHRLTNKPTPKPAKSKGSRLQVTQNNLHTKEANHKPSLEINTRKIDTYFQRGKGTADISARGLTNNCSSNNLTCLKGPKGGAETTEDTRPRDKTRGIDSTFVVEPDLDSIPLMRET